LRLFSYLFIIYLKHVNILFVKFKPIDAIFNLASYTPIYVLTKFSTVASLLYFVIGFPPYVTPGCFGIVGTVFSFVYILFSNKAWISSWPWWSAKALGVHPWSSSLPTSAAWYKMDLTIHLHHIWQFPRANPSYFALHL